MGLRIAAGIHPQRPPCLGAAQFSSHPNRTRNPSSARTGDQPDPPRLLWIDDEIAPDSIEVRFLKAEGFLIDCAVTGTAGLALARTGDYQLILLDLRLPDIPGLSVLANVRANNIRTPVLVVTGFGDLESAHAAGQLGTVAFEAKPVFIDDLKLSIERILKGLPAATRGQNHHVADDQGRDGATFRSLAALFETLHGL